MATNKNSSNTYALNYSLQKIVKGTGLVLIGTLMRILFGSIAGVLIARNWTEIEVGIFSLALIVFSISETVSALGMDLGVVQRIAHSRGKKEFNKIPDFIVTSVFFSILTSIILGLILFLFSEVIAENIFHETSLILPLKICAIALPFFTLNMKIVSIFRGFENIKPMVYFKFILESALFPIFIAGIVIFGLSFIYVFYAYICSGIFISMILIVYNNKQSPSLTLFSLKSIFSPTAKELIVFSFPLFGTAILGMILSSTDTLMLGGLKSAADVGFYNIAAPFAAFISFPMGALLIVFTPIFSGLYGKGQLGEMRSNYLILTKWICLATLPVFIIFFIFPELTLSVIVGSKYLPSANVLRILSLAYIISNFAGPCSSTLIAMGKSRFIMFSTLSAAILNIILNAILIPTYSFLGAATAITATYAFFIIITIWKMYSLGKITPFSWNLIKPTLFSIAFIVPIYFFSQQFLSFNWWSLTLLFILFYGIYILSVLLTKSLDEEDLKMLVAIERKTGIKTTRINKFLSKFL